MKFAFYPFALIFAVVCLVSCKETHSEAVLFCEPDPPVWTFNSDSVELGTADFYTFDIERDYSKLNEKLWTDPEKKQYVENIDFDDVINIVYNGNKAVVEGDESSDLKVKTNGAHVVINTKKDVACTLTGKSQNGSLEIVGDGKVRINLNGVSLKNVHGPVISNHSQKVCYLVTDSASVLADDSVYAQVVDSMMPKGCVYCKGKLAISGKAQLKIVASGADAIHSGKSIFVRRCTNLDIESHRGNAIKAKNNIYVEGGVININSTAAGCCGLAAKKDVAIAGGRTTIVSNTGNGKDGKNARCIKSDSLVTITGGIVRVKDSSVGGKGIRAGHKFLAKNCIVDVLTYGVDDKLTGSKNRGIKGTDEIRIDSSRVRVRAENGWTEGLSTQNKVIISNSLVELKTRDDGISAGEEGMTDIEVNNSRIFSDAGMDCIDAKTLHMNSGLIFGIAHSNLCRAFDCDHNEFKVGPDATIVGISNATSHPTKELLGHPACYFSRPLTVKQICISTTGEKDNLVSFDTPRLHFDDMHFRVLLSVPEFKKGVSYDFCHSARVEPKHTFHGLLIGGTVKSKTVAEKHSFSTNYTEIEPPVPQTTASPLVAKGIKDNQTPVIEAK